MYSNLRRSLVCRSNRAGSEMAFIFSEMSIKYYVCDVKVSRGNLFDLVARNSTV